MANPTDTLRPAAAPTPPRLRVDGAGGIGKTTFTVGDPGCRIETTASKRAVSPARRNA